MKNFTSVMFVLITALTVAISTESCKKNSDTTATAAKGCNDPEAIDYSASAKGTICTYPADKLAGTWKVLETSNQTNDSINYTATITKVDNKTINIKNNSDYPATVPPYHKDNMTMQIQWSDKTFVPNGTITGSIVDVNSKWTLSYTATGSFGNSYKVKQTYTK